MKILLIGGGSGGHITPLLAVARELKLIDSNVELIGICEKNATFAHLYEENQYIDSVYQVSAGKYRRYSGLTWYQRLFDIKTLLLNMRDVTRTVLGYVEAKKILKKLSPDAILIKGGFVAVPIGRAAAKLKIPYITHDSDSTPGLANRLISTDATVHATGMPAELYSYPADKTVYTGIPVSDNFKKVTSTLKTSYRANLGLQECQQVITIVGGSQGAGQLNDDMLKIAGRLMQKFPQLGIIHVAGKAHESVVREHYSKELRADEFKRVVVQGFVSTIAESQGAADVVVSRAGATQIAELAIQALPVIVVPGQLAGGHQDKNADYLESLGAVMNIAHANSEALFDAITLLLTDSLRSDQLRAEIHKLAKPHAARELATITRQIIKPRTHVS
jgi:UDP-N-acetylglucosamine--N-acetylmuramyl-(pentapeptide) pyrophosphoryl-undecaprenol N-acetylglucosamine transferase